MNEHEVFRYSIKAEQRLSALVRDGDAEGVLRALDEIFEENLGDEPASGQEKRLQWALCTTLSRLLEEIEDAERRRTILKQMEVLTELAPSGVVFDGIRTLMRELTLEYRRGVRVGTGAVVAEIREYLKENYFDQDLNLNSTAERFGLSVSYLSQVFRKIEGVNFSVYLESLRVEKACEYLIQGMPVKRVAERVGYNSVYVFRKAFLRRKSVLPSDYGASRQMRQVGRNSNESTSETRDQ